MGIMMVGQFLAGGLLVWLGLLGLLIAVRMLRGTIRVSGFLAHSVDGPGGAVVPERVVAMVSFPFVLGLYTLNALHTDVSGTAGPPSLPDVSQYLLTILAGGNSLYLAGKIARGT